jgi:hypothetical protein
MKRNYVGKDVCGGEDQFCMCLGLGICSCLRSIVDLACREKHVKFGNSQLFPKLKRINGGVGVFIMVLNAIGDKF